MADVLRDVRPAGKKKERDWQELVKLRHRLDGGNIGLNRLLPQRKAGSIQRTVNKSCIQVTF